jgi:large subunit ribosomal protein L7A
VPTIILFPELWRMGFMSYDKVKQAKNMYIGTKKATRVVELGQATEVFIAKDADPRITIKMVNLCKRMDIPVTYVDSMKMLGKACGIEVGAAIAAVVNE